MQMKIFVCVCVCVCVPIHYLNLPNDDVETQHFWPAYLLRCGDWFGGVLLCVVTITRLCVENRWCSMV